METIKRAIEFHKKGDYKNAEKFYIQFLEKNPDEAKAHHLLGAVYMQTGEIELALQSLSRAYLLDKSLPIETDFALCLYESRNYSASFVHLKNILKGSDSRVLYERILDCALRLGLKEEYLDYALKFIELFGEEIEILRNLAGFAIDLDKLDIAERYYKKIIELVPDDYIAHNNMALVYEFNLNFPLAEEYYRKAIEIKPNLDPVYNLSVLLRREKRFDESFDMLQKAREYGLTDIAHDCTLGLLKLTRKDFSGFPLYMNFVKSQHKFLKKTQWDGKPDKNILLLLCATEGFGDIFMFARYLDFVDVNLFRDVIIASPEPVLELLAYNFPNFKVVNAESNIPYDKNDIIMNLPNVFNLDFEHIPSSGKYLMAPPLYLEKWRGIFNKEKFNVGIFYSGSYLNKRSLRNRNVDFELLKPLFDLEDELKNKVQFYSMQPEKRFTPEIEEQNAKTGNIEALEGKIENFSDTAAIVEYLDLIISIDSSVANLAGALGKKTFLLLPNSPDWRWFDNDKKTQWYDSVQIFKQSKEGEWQEPLNRVKKALIDEIRAK